MVSVSNRDLYPFIGNNPSRASALLVTISSSDLWGRRLRHPDAHTFSTMANDFLSDCNTATHSPCSACQLGHQTCLPFSSSFSKTIGPFDL
uniref:GAG-pre-integrase domain-containing protein n=1 Tax=Aegilops tauschii subsp. strangulata TaxID=200361 RepID=A0A453BS38_AEGTS